jgi:hypothetical protein
MACVISERFGVFVSPSGSDTTGTGTRSAPYATITHGISAGINLGKKVYVCADAGAYGESLDLGTGQDGLAVYGGFRCSDWSYDLARRARVNATGVIGLRIQGLATGVTLENLEISAKNASVSGQSSLGAFITTSKNVTLRRLRILAGAGAAGTDGESFTMPAENGAPGNPGAAACNANPNPGGPSATTQCIGAASASVGGKGGDGGSGANSGGIGNSGLPSDTGGQPGFGEALVGWSCSVGGTNGGANAGANGAAGTLGKGGTGAGVLDGNGFAGVSGTAGGSGGVGQGGGGGGGAKAPLSCALGTPTGASAGGGGGGGCAGKGGGAGEAGGASIAVAIVNSTVRLESCDLTAQGGGAGGKGGQGQQGGLGGLGGSGASGISGSKASCPGGVGGEGGSGGPGGGGAGGPSIGIAYVGTAPVQSGGSVVLGAQPGPGGADGLGATTGAGAGAAGLVADQKAF